jgi:hypothetical protein
MCKECDREESNNITLVLVYSWRSQCVEESEVILGDGEDSAQVGSQVELLRHVSAEKSKKILCIVGDCAPGRLQIAAVEHVGAEESEEMFSITGDLIPV